MRSRQIQDALEGEWFRWRKANANVLKLKPQLPRKSLTHPEWYHMPRIFALPAHLAIGFVCPLNSLKDSSFFLFSRIYHSAWCVCGGGGGSVMSNSLWPHGLQPARPLHLGTNTGEGCHFLLQDIFWTQISNLHLIHLLHWQVDSLTQAPPGKPGI